MRSCNQGIQTDIKPEGAGPSLTIVVSQANNDPGGWLLEVYARFKDMDASRVFLDRFYLSQPNATTIRATRVVYCVTIPAASGFFIQVTGPQTPTPLDPIQVGCFVSDMTAFINAANVHP